MRRLKAAPLQAVSVSMPEVLVTSLYSGYIRRSLGIYCKRIAIFMASFVFKGIGPFAAGMITNTKS